MTERRKFLLRCLGNIQNHPANHHRDIMTFAGMCSDDELSAHVHACSLQIEKREAAR